MIGKLLLVVFALISFTDAYEISSEMHSINGSGYEHLIYTPYRDNIDSSTNGQSHSYSERNSIQKLERESPYIVLTGYTMELEINSNNVNPYILIFRRSASRPEVTSGILQVVSQPPIKPGMKSVISSEYWFGLYGPYSTWFVNLSEKDFVNDSVHGPHYVLNMTKEDLIWDENGSILALKFCPNNPDIGISSYIYELEPDNTLGHVSTGEFGYNSKNARPGALLAPNIGSNKGNDATSSWYEKGLAFFNLGKYNESIGCYDKAIEIDPRNGGAWMGKGEALFALGRYEDAIGCYDMCIEVSPAPVNGPWYKKEEALRALGRHKEADAALAKAREVSEEIKSMGLIKKI